MFLVVGGDSEIGAATAEHLRCHGGAVAATTRRNAQVAPDRPLLDLAAPLDGWNPPAGTTAACIVAGIARIAACAADPEASAFINIDRTLALADRVLARGASVVFLSSNHVFDGTRSHVPPAAPTCPVSTYGRQKARAEALLRERAAAGMPVAILRITKAVSPDIALFGGWAMELKNGRSIRAFGDMRVAPVPVALVSQAIAALLADRATGIFQLSGPRDVTYADVARELARRLAADERLVEPVSALSAGLPDGATPRHTTLDSARVEERCGFVVPDVFDVLAPMLASAYGKRT
jgi:dTDP-4-dehydrorhamnose reductase